MKTAEFAEETARPGPALFFFLPSIGRPLFISRRANSNQRPDTIVSQNVYSQLLWSSNFTEIGRDAGHQHLVKSREAEAMSSFAIRGIYRWNDYPKRFESADRHTAARRLCQTRRENQKINLKIGTTTSTSTKETNLVRVYKPSSGSNDPSHRVKRTK